MFNMNELCIELQIKYESIIDLIEREKSTIWNYPSQPDESATNRFNLISNDSIKTDFSKLGKFNLLVIYDESEIYNISCLIRHQV